MEGSDLLRPIGFEEVEHTADWAYRVWGETLEELFFHAPRITRSIHLQGIDHESLLVAWLNELIHLHESESLGFDDIEILHLDEQTLQAQVTGAPTQQWLKEIKAATYHNLAIRSTELGFEATLVLDV
jgi:SHS2 domain-containing protein